MCEKKCCRRFFSIVVSVLLCLSLTCSAVYFATKPVRAIAGVDDALFWTAVLVSMTVGGTAVTLELKPQDSALIGKEAHDVFGVQFTNADAYRCFLQDFIGYLPSYAVMEGIDWDAVLKDIVTGSNETGVNTPSGSSGSSSSSTSSDETSSEETSSEETSSEETSSDSVIQKAVTKTNIFLSDIVINGSRLITRGVKSGLTWCVTSDVFLISALASFIGEVKAGDYSDLNSDYQYNYKWTDASRYNDDSSNPYAVDEKINKVVLVVGQKYKLDWSLDATDTFYCSFGRDASSYYWAQSKYWGTIYSSGSFTFTALTTDIYFSWTSTDENSGSVGFNISSVSSDGTTTPTGTASSGTDVSGVTSSDGSATQKSDSPVSAASDITLGGETSTDAIPSNDVISGDTTGLTSGTLENVDTSNGSTSDDGDTGADDTSKIDWSPLELSVSGKFPFCVPFDLVRGVTGLVAEKTAPVWTVTWPSFFGETPTTSTIAPMTGWENVVAILRWALSLAWLFFLIMVSRKLMKT